MNIYTVEIDGVAIAAFNADDKDTATLFVEGEEFRHDLLSYDTETGPLWNGVDPIEIRAAHPEEAKQFQDSLVDGLANGEDSEIWVIFLVPVIDPSDDDDEDATDKDDEK